MSSILIQIGVLAISGIIVGIVVALFKQWLNNRKS